MDRSNARYQRLGYLALNVSDLERSARFYEDIVGLQRSETRGNSVFFRCSDRHHDIVLHKAPTPGLKRIGWQMEAATQVQTLEQHFHGLGIPTQRVSNREAVDLATDGGFRMREPTTGVLMEFYSHMDTASEVFHPSHTKIERLGHVVLASADMAETEKFFAENMNFKVSDRIENGVVHMRCFPNPLHHSFGIGAGQAAQLHHVNFMVTDMDDIGRANTRMKSHKVPIVYGPGKHPQSESVFFYFLDPDGLTLEYSYGMEEFPEQDARAPRLFPMKVESVDHWGGLPEPDFAKVGAIETAET